MENPPHVGRIPPTLEYLRICALEMAYIDPAWQNETPRAFRRKVYDKIRTISLANTKPTDMRITKHYPITDWARVWAILQTTWASDAMNVNWYMVIHDIIPTKERLHAIRLTDSTQCRICGENGTGIHRIAECGEETAMWKWTRIRIAALLRTDQTQVPQEWILRPNFHTRTPRQHGAVLWIVAHMVWFRMQERRAQSAQDYSDFLRRTRWKAYHTPGRVKLVGNYLQIP
jgi:hypothetical protein